MTLFNNRRRDFSQQSPRTPVIPGVLSVIDTASIDLTFNASTQTLQADLTTILTGGTFGSSTQIPVLTVNPQGRITSISQVPVAGGGGSVLLQTNGTPNPTQTLLNLVAGTNMTITDDGLGNITFDATGGGATYTVDNGLTESPANNFQLGGTLVQDTLINTSIYEMVFSSIRPYGSATSEFYNLDQGQAIYAESIDDVAIVGYSNQDSGGYFSSDEGTPISGAILDSPDNNSVLPLIGLNRKTVGSATNGIGGSIQFRIETSTNTLRNSLDIKNYWTNVIDANRTSAFELWLANGGTNARKLLLAGSGQLTLDNYTGSTFDASPTKSLGVDASGNVITFTGGGGGGGRSYYLNGSVIQGTFGGIVDMREISPVPVIGAGTDFTINTNGYIESFITDAGDPNKAVIPAGNWNFELWFSANSNGGSPSFYVELSKYDTVGGTFTPIATSSATPEGITNGIAIDLYLTALSVPQTTLALTDRLAVRIFVNNSSRTITLHTQGPHLSQIITNFPSGINSLNGLTAFVQNFATPGTSGTAPNWSSVLDAHTLNIPLASVASVTAGLISKAEYDTFNGKQDALTLTTTGTSGAATLIGATLNIPQYSGGPGGNSIGQLTSPGDVTTVAATAPSQGLTATLDPNYKEGGATAIFDGGGSLITNGKIAYARIPYKGTITGWFLAADQSGSCSIAVKQGLFSPFPPTTTIITAALSGTQTAQAPTVLSLPVLAGDWLSFTISGVATITWVNLSILITKTL